tara:strand:- start:298 stop:579 length:282 start_codon:yes stop_codon:yes gene_type:complete
MASKDFLYDLLDKLEEEQTEYVLLTMEPGEEETTGELHYNFYYEDSQKNAARLLGKLAKIIKDNPPELSEIEIDLSEDDKDDWDKKYDDDDEE